MKRAEQILANTLKTNKLNLALAESMTCGLAAHRLGSVSRTSDILTGSIVCYDESVKINLLKISKRLIDKYSSESQEVTDRLARNLRKIIQADIYASITGLASPGGSETRSKPVGTVFFSVLYKKKQYRMKKYFKGSPLQVKEKTCRELFRFITGHIQRS